MSDVVNDYFRRFYPPDWSENWRSTPGPGNGIMREYCGDRTKWSAIFPSMVCADGFTMSVQGHCGAYSHPRDDFADRYSEVEIMAPSGIAEFKRENEMGDGDSIYPYVPVETVCEFIAKHGGLEVKT